MKYDKFLREVRERAEIADREEAELTAVAVVQALCDRLTGDEAGDLLAQLPEPLKSSIMITPGAERMTVNDFVEYVAGELGVEPDEARKRIRAVFSTIRDAVTPGEFHDVLVQLPSGYVELLDGAPTERRPPAA
jgi:uncharacterized protein (DUF2267 family)